MCPRRPYGAIAPGSTRGAVPPQLQVSGAPATSWPLGAPAPIEREEVGDVTTDEDITERTSPQRSRGLTVLFYKLLVLLVVRHSLGSYPSYVLRPFRFALYAGQCRAYRNCHAVVHTEVYHRWQFRLLVTDES